MCAFISLTRSDPVVELLVQDVETAYQNTSGVVRLKFWCPLDVG